MQISYKFEKANIFFLYSINEHTNHPSQRASENHTLSNCLRVCGCSNSGLLKWVNLSCLQSRLELKMSYFTFTPAFVDSRWNITGKSSIITNGKCIANVFKHGLKSNLYFWYVIWMWTQINKDSLNTFTSVWWSSSRWFGPWLVPFMMRMTVSFSSDKTGYTANKTS